MANRPCPDLINEDYRWHICQRFHYILYLLHCQSDFYLPLERYLSIQKNRLNVSKNGKMKKEKIYSGSIFSLFTIVCWDEVFY